MEAQFVTQENARGHQDVYSLATETVLKSTNSIVRNTNEIPRNSRLFNKKMQLFAQSEFETKIRIISPHVACLKI